MIKARTNWKVSISESPSVLILFWSWTFLGNQKEKEWCHWLISIYISRYRPARKFRQSNTTTIRILHGCENRVRVSTPRVTVFASWGFAEWCKTVIQRERIFCPHRWFDYFSCLPFGSDCFICFIVKISFITTQNDVDVWQFLKFEVRVTSQWRQTDDKVTSRDVLYNQCKPNPRLLSYPR